MAGQHNDHTASVWRACWNVTGTILATAGDDGQVKLWKTNYLDQWKCMATLYGCGEGGQAWPQFSAPTATNDKRTIYM